MINIWISKISINITPQSFIIYILVKTTRSLWTKCRNVAYRLDLVNMNIKKPQMNLRLHFLSWTEHIRFILDTSDLPCCGSLVHLCSTVLLKERKRDWGQRQCWYAECRVYLRVQTDISFIVRGKQKVFKAKILYAQGSIMVQVKKSKWHLKTRAVWNISF